MPRWWSSPFFAAVSVVEPLKYGSTLLVLPLYTRLHREEVLDQFVRGKVLGYIVANPGDHYNAIMRELGLRNGSFAYHVSTLEREGYVRGIRDGRYRRFYPANSPVPTHNALDNRQRILRLVRLRPGVTKREIAEVVGISRVGVRYHVRLLEMAGLLTSRTRDGAIRHSATDEAGGADSEEE